MNRRYFLYSCSLAAAAFLTGCEDKNKDKDNLLQKTLQNEEEKKKTDLYEPFTQSLKIPEEINFKEISKAFFKAQNNSIMIFPDKTTDVLTFKGDLPNPTIRIKNKSTFELDFTNGLPLPTIIHWHGLVIPEEMDGHPKDAIERGKTKHYKYKVNQRAGTYWYHTHPHGRTGKEVYYGLSGFYIIEDEKEKSFDLPGGEFEIPLLIQDKRFDQNRQLIYKQKVQDNNGVLGDTVLVNCTPFPYKDVKNTKYRLRILNGSSVRTYKLAFEGLESFTLIGTDAGLLEEPVQLKDIVIAVAERVDIVVDFKDKKIGDEVVLRSLGFKEASNFILNPDYPGLEAKMDIIKFKITQNHKGKISPLPERFTNIRRIKESDALKTRTITMEIGSGGVWTLDKKTYDINRIDQRVKLGTTEIWVIKNTAHMAHPFHMHGVHFQVLDRTGSIVFPTDKGWKDTVLVMPNETVRIIIPFTMPGIFLYHCHILEHEDHAMMANYMVEE